MNILIDASMIDRGKVEIDDMHDVTNVETTGGHSSRDQDGSLGLAKATPVYARQ